MKAVKPQYKPSPTSYGGTLLKTRAGRKHARPLAINHSMHLVLRSTKATGDWSFKKRANEFKIVELLNKFSRRHGVHVYNLANVGNHLHFHIKLSRRHSYYRFIRAFTAAIAMAVTGSSRWNPLKLKFWDHRPFTRIVQGYRQFLTLKDYINVNIFEGMGFSRTHARLVLSQFKPRPT